MPDPIPQQAETAALAEQFQRFHGAEILPLTHPVTGDQESMVALVPTGKSLVSLKAFLDEYLEKPRRRVGQARVKDVASFVEHVTRFKSADSIVFANPSRGNPQFLAVLDYHSAGPDTTDTDWLQHRTLYELPLSDEWKVWTASNGKGMGQAAFAEFLEDRITDVLDTSAEGDDQSLKELALLVGGSFASPSTLLGLSRGLQVNVESTVRNVVTLDSGAIDIQWSEAHKDGTGLPIKIANLFVIAIPVFYNGPKYRLPVRLRYRVQGGKIEWRYQLIRSERAFDDAYEGTLQQIKTGTNLDVIIGSPEGATA